MHNTCLFSIMKMLRTFNIYTKLKIFFKNVVHIKMYLKSTEILHFQLFIPVKLNDQSDTSQIAVQRSEIDVLE